MVIKEIYCSTTTWYWVLRVSLRQILLINRPVSLMTAHSAAKLFRDLPERPPVEVDPEAIRTPTVSWCSATPKLSNLGFNYVMYEYHYLVYIFEFFVLTILDLFF